MCGIAGVHRLSDRDIPKLDQLADALLDGIVSRGRDATGLAAIVDDGTVYVQKAAVDAHRFARGRRMLPPTGVRTLLLHTRWATQGSPEWPENNHPVMRRGIYVVHNGHVSNDAALIHATGYGRYAHVDSEAIPAAIAAAGWGNAAAALATVDGSLAIAAFNREHPGAALLARGNDSPLVYVQHDDFVVWASTADAIERAWRKVLGTPPKGARYQTLGEGTLLRLDRGELATERFKPKPRPVWHRSAWTAADYATGSGLAKPKPPKPGAAKPRPLTPPAAKTAAATTAAVNGATVTDDVCAVCDADIPADVVPALVAGRTVCPACWADDADADADPDALVKCDDCGDWTHLADLTLHGGAVRGLGDLLCATCLDWAEGRAWRPGSAL